MTRLRPHKTDPVLNDEPFRPKRKLFVLSHGNEVTVEYQRSRWSLVGGYEDGVRRRVTRSRICANGAHAGSLEVVEYEIPWLMSASDFIFEMDAHSSATYELAEVLCAHWEEPSDLSEYGNIVELKRAWMRPAQSSTLHLKATVDALLAHLFGDRSLLILKAFPLEYEGEVTSANASFFRRRQSAMARHYCNLFGVTPLPGANGEAGWMYAVPKHLTATIPAPTL